MKSGWDRDRLASIVVEAGRYAHKQQNALTAAALSRKSDDTLVTEIDIAVEKQVSAALLRLNPDSYIMGEETIKTQSEEYLQRALGGECWVIDPIDGTVPYAFGFDTWGVSVGYMVDSVICEGAIYLPASRLLLISDGDTVYSAIGDTADQMHLEPLQRPAPRHPRGIISVSQDLACYGTIRASHAIQSIGSCVYSSAQYLCGKYAGVITNVKLWDIAAAIALFDKAGHSILLHSGETVHGDTTKSSFRLAPQTDPHSRWSIRSHIFIAPNNEECQTLISSVTVG